MVTSNSPEDYILPGDEDFFRAIASLSLGLAAPALLALVGGDLAFDNFRSSNPITHTFNSSSRTASSVAGPTHVFQGRVDSRVLVAGDRVVIVTSGRGPSNSRALGEINNLVGASIFVESHQQALPGPDRPVFSNGIIGGSIIL